jgi:hypothetical protein
MVRDGRAIVFRDKTVGQVRTVTPATAVRTPKRATRGSCRCSAPGLFYSVAHRAGVAASKVAQPALLRQFE